MTILTLICYLFRVKFIIYPLLYSWRNLKELRFRCLCQFELNGEQVRGFCLRNKRFWNEPINANIYSVLFDILKLSARRLLRLSFLRHGSNVPLDWDETRGANLSLEISKFSLYHTPHVFFSLYLFTSLALTQYGNYLTGSWIWVATQSCCAIIRYYFENRLIKYNLIKQYGRLCFRGREMRNSIVKFRKSTRIEGRYCSLSCKMVSDHIGILVFSNRLALFDPVLKSITGLI